MTNYLTPSEAANQLNIKTSTIRKYSLMMEEAGYNFTKGENGKRYFRHDDVITIQRIITAKNNTDMTLKDLIHSIVTELKGANIMVSDTPQERYGADIGALLERIHNQLDDTQEIKSGIRDQSQKIDDQGEQIRTMLQLMQEQQQEIKRLNEKIEAASEAQPGFFSKLFKKK